MISYCRNCGANLEPGAKTCKRCGAEVSQHQPEEEPGLAERLMAKLKNLRRNKLFWPLAAAALVLLSMICMAAVFAGKSRDAEPAATPALETQMPDDPAGTAQPSPEPSEEPKAEWVDTYKSFLETDPMVNSRLVMDAEEYGFEGTVTAELFALADINNDDVPELLLAQKPEKLPGWNVSGESGLAVESYIVCEINEGRVSPLMCGGVDYEIFPLAISVNNSWILEQTHGAGAGHSMEFRSPLDQSSCRSLRYEFSIEQRCNSKGQLIDVPVERYSSDGDRISELQYMEALFPDGAETLEYYPIFFRELKPGCLDDLEESWNGRSVSQLSRIELDKLGSAAGSGGVQTEYSGILPYISDVYCITADGDENDAVIVLGIDSAAGWDYVREISVATVSAENTDAWVHSSTTESLPEGQIFEFVVGLAADSALTGSCTVTSEIKLKLYDGTELSRSFTTSCPVSSIQS